MTDEEKIIEFNKKLKVLLAEYGLGMSAEPFIDGDGSIKAKPAVFHMKDLKESVLKET